MSKELEKVVTEKVKPIVDETIERIFKVNLPSISSDITDKIKASKGFVVDTSIQFKEAKKQFKKHFLQKLVSTFGNITEVSKIAGIKRESLHRLVKQFKIKTDESLKHYMKKEAVKTIVEDTLDTYKTALNPKRVDDMYDSLPQLTEDIVEQLPEEPKTLKEAEHEFEKEYIKKALEENQNNISQTARKIGLRFETLHRKMKELGI